MGIYTLVLGLIFLVVALISLKRGRIFAGGRLTRGKITGKTVYYIAVPQAIAGGMAVVVGAADLAGFSTIGQYSGIMISVLVGTYLITNLGIGFIFQVRSAINEARQLKES